MAQPVEPGPPGLYIKRRREAAKWSQREVANRAGLTQSTISALENGKVEFTQHYVDILAPVFGIGRGRLAQLVGITKEMGLEDPDPEEERLRREYAELLAQFTRVQGVLETPMRNTLLHTIRAVIDAAMIGQEEMRLFRGQRFRPQPKGIPDDEDLQLVLDA